LAELLMTVVIMSILALSLGLLASAVQQNCEHTFGSSAALQHARVALGRIEHHISTASASADFPGFAVFSEVESGDNFPETLVVWHPDGAPADAGGLPRFSELVIYAPNPAAPNELLEITVPGDNRTTPHPSQTATWDTELDAIKAGNTAEKVVLLDMLHVAAVTSGSAEHGCVRFIQRLLPSADDWDDYQSSTTAWESLPWVQDIYGSQTGLRQSWCRIELQLEANEPGTSLGSGNVVPFFGSAALYYQLTK